jgi:hypothetical protein
MPKNERDDDRSLQILGVFYRPIERNTESRVKKRVERIMSPERASVEVSSSVSFKDTLRTARPNGEIRITKSIMRISVKLNLIEIRPQINM